MKFLYIGQYSDGTTSKQRGSMLEKIVSSEFKVIDTNIPFNLSPRIFRSLGFRYKIGPLINEVNKYVLNNLEYNYYDIIWLDKAIYITEKTTRILRTKTDKLIHFSPDPQFTFHKSKHFFRSGIIYDYLITTKSYELNEYKSKFGKEKIIYTTQGFDKSLHQPHPTLNKSGICFLGHHEKERGTVIKKLLETGIEVKLAGIKWSDFVKKNRHYKNLIYLGNGVYGEDYVKTISSSFMAWGALSKWVDELHTTRTFEIPACGTALVTERNNEIEGFFDEDEVIFYDSLDELIEKVKYYFENLKELKELTQRGSRRVQSDGRNYESILKNVLKEMNIV